VIVSSQPGIVASEVGDARLYQRVEPGQQGEGRGVPGPERARRQAHRGRNQVHEAGEHTGVLEGQRVAHALVLPEQPLDPRGDHEQDLRRARHHGGGLGVGQHPVGGRVQCRQPGQPVPDRIVVVQPGFQARALRDQRVDLELAELASGGIGTGPDLLAVV
jgi:hypothetical protein